MKSRVIELQEKANQLLELAQAMDKRLERAVKLYYDFRNEFPETANMWANKADTRKRASKRLWSAYLQVLTEIKLEL